MIALVAWIGGVASGWLIVAGLIAVGVGRAIRIADRREQVRS